MWNMFLNHTNRLYEHKEMCGKQKERGNWEREFGLIKDRGENKKGKRPLGGEQQGPSVVGRRRVAVGGKGGPGTQRQRNTHSCRVSTPISLYCSSCFTWASSCFSLESCGHKAEHRVNMAQQWASLIATRQNCLVMTVHIHERSAVFIDTHTHTHTHTQTEWFM